MQLNTADGGQELETVGVQVLEHYVDKKKYTHNFFVAKSLVHQVILGLDWLLSLLSLKHSL